MEIFTNFIILEYITCIQLKTFIITYKLCIASYTEKYATYGQIRRHKSMKIG